MAAGAPGETFLLHGVTGSGKTLVYIELLERVVRERGRTAVVLVPEIALTPQTVDRFRAAFGDTVAVLHSALGDGERYDAWRALRRGEKRIVVGARSAVFAPLDDVGAIVVDEEHESSYKQGESPRYHAREVAVVRARAAGAVVVLGSATPSLESWQNARAGKYTLLELPDRAGGARLPQVDVVDLREPGGAAGARAVQSAVNPLAGVVSPPLEAALDVRLERGEQSILLLNRRGYSAFVQCRECGDVATCPDCSISLTYHRSPERLVCHYCQHHEPVRERCARCRGATLRQKGVGTQQVERLLSERWPAARVARMDVDTTGAKWSHAEILDRVGRGEVDVLLGTQMIAKGLDFPNVTLVGVIDADTGINLPDFRASERCFQLLSQVAGRAGRGPKGGEVLIQTRVPGHHAVRCALAHDYAAFVAEELAGRREPPYPPTVRLANVVVSGTSERAVARAPTARPRGCGSSPRAWRRGAPGARRAAGRGAGALSGRADQAAVAVALPRAHRATRRDDAGAALLRGTVRGAQARRPAGGHRPRPHGAALSRSAGAPSLVRPPRARQIAGVTLSLAHPDLAAARLAAAPDARFEPAPADGVLPEGFFSTTNLPTYVRVGGVWRMPREPRMDSALVLDAAGTLWVREGRRVRAGERVAVGHAEDGREGIYVHAGAFMGAGATASSSS
jgi:primosomal protein N'